MYQPKIKDDLIRKLYFRARKEGKKMTHLINAILEEYLVDEPEPPPYEDRKYITVELHPDSLQRKIRLFDKLLQEYQGENAGAE